MLERGLDLALCEVGLLDFGPRELGLLLRVDRRGLGDGEGNEASEDVGTDELGDVGRAVRLLDGDWLRGRKLLDLKK